MRAWTKTRLARSVGCCALVVGLLAGAACGSGGGGAGGQGGIPIPTQPEGSLPLLGGDCDPIAHGGYCGLPFPSNVYLEDDASSATGKRVRFGEQTLPQQKNGQFQRIPPSYFFDHDGFSPAQAPMTHLPRATPEGCATPYTIERSLEADSPTVLIDAETGERIPHWVDIDATTEYDGTGDLADYRAFMVRPVKMLAPGRRYIVAIRQVKNYDGEAIAPTPAFEALRSGKLLAEGTDAEKWSVYARQELYDDIFGRLEQAGVGRDDLQVAWDFSTASRDNITGHLVEMRDLALAAVGAEGPTFEVIEVQEFPTEADNPNKLRSLQVRMTVPLYLTTGDNLFVGDEPLGRLNLDESGSLQQNGTMEMDVLIHVPRSVLTGAKHGLLQNGHGLFGSRFEGQNGYLAEAANLHQYIAFSVNLFGFDDDGSDLAAQVLTGRIEGIKSFPERQIQGMVNQLLAMRMMMGRVATDGIVDAQGNVLVDPEWIDADVRGYRGDSQGGIMGATYMAVSTDVTRGLLGEPGTPYNVLLNRSIDYNPYNALLGIGWGDVGIDKQLMLGLIQMEWDRVEPSGFSPYIENDLLPGTPKHAVLLHVARGDHQVTTFGAHILARNIGAKQLASDDPAQPVWEEYFGVPTVTGPVTDTSVMVEYEFGLAPNPARNLANQDGCDPHDRVRVLTPSYDQQDEFFRTGVISWHCKGACNCDDTGADANQEEGCTQSFDQQCQ